MKDLYNHELLSDNMEWEDSRMYKDIKMEGWPEDIERLSPSHLVKAKKRKLEENLDKIQFVISPTNEQQNQD